jgi:hypothetical protein
MQKLRMDVQRGRTRSTLLSSSAWLSRASRFHRGIHRFAILKTMTGTNDQEAGRVGLCATCQFMRRMASDKGSVFYLCERSKTDPSFPKYPRLPILQCRGYEAVQADS